MNNDIHYILEKALLAPSGDNTQPWHWKVRGETLELWSRFPNDPLHDLYSSSSNRGSSSYLALGTAIENACIAATTRQYRAHVTYLPDPSEPTLVARVDLARDSHVPADALAPFISRRMTNRRPFRRTHLTAQEREHLLAAAHDEHGTLRLVEDRASIDTLATVASLQDRMMFSVKDLHDYIFSNINWTRRQDERRRVGFSFPTLAAPPFSWIALQFLRHWPIARIAASLGLHRLIALEQRLTYRCAAAYGLILAQSDTPLDWIRAGRAVERVWLTAASLGLSLHPLNGAILLTLGIESATAKQAFTDSERHELHQGRDTIARLFHAESNTIAFMFRIGHGRPPSARTARLPFDKVVTEST